MKTKIIPVVIAAVGLSACQSATFSSQLKGTHIPAGLEKNSAVAKACDNTTQTAGLIVGALLGAALAGDGNRNQGAVLGAAAGGLIGGVLNKAECDVAIAQAQKAMRNPNVTYKWTGHDGNYGHSVLKIEEGSDYGVREDVVWANGKEVRSSISVKRLPSGRFVAA